MGSTVAEVDALAYRQRYRIPTMMGLRVPPAVAEAVARAAIETGVARNPVVPAVVAENAREYLYEGHLHLLA